MKKTMSVLLYSAISTFPLLGGHYFNENGYATDYLKKQFNIIGLQPASYDAATVDSLLQSVAFQRDNDFYLNGNKGNLNISKEQAIASLEYEYTQRTIVLPDITSADAIVQIGCKVNVKKRITTLCELLKQGCTIHKIHFIGKSCDCETFKNYLSEEEKKIITNIEHDIIKASKKSEEGLYILEDCFNKVSPTQSDVILIADEPFGPRAEETMRTILEPKGFHSLGYASIPEKDWRKDLRNFEYDQSPHLTTEDDQIIAFCKSSWNILARNVHESAKRFAK